MVLFLRLNIMDHIWHLRFGIGKHAIPGLPFKPASTKAIEVYPLRRVRFHILHKIGNRLGGAKADQHVQMIAHPIDSDHLVLPCLDTAGDVFVKVSFPVSSDQCLAVFGCKDEMRVNLRVGVCHDRCV